MTGAGASTGQARLLRRGFVPEYTTLGWNVVGIVVLAVAAITARSVALAVRGFERDQRPPCARCARGARARERTVVTVRSCAAAPADRLQLR